jgi:hypothetical protein
MLGQTFKNIDIFWQILAVRGELTKYSLYKTFSGNL